MTTLEWNTQAEWDAAQSRESVVTRNLGDRVGDEVWLGWDPQHGPLTDVDLYTPLDESSGSITDYSANAFSGTVTGGTYDVRGVLGSTSLGLDGVDDRVDFGDVLNTTGSLTLTVVFWWNQKANDHAIIAGKSEASNENFDIREWGSDGVIRGMVRVDGSNYTNVAFNISSTGGPYICSLVFDSTGPTLSSHTGANATQQNSATVSASTLNTTTEPFSYGARGDGSGGWTAFSNIDLSEVFLWQRALSGSELDAVHGALSSGSLTTGKKTS